MSVKDRSVSLILVIAATIAWLSVAIMFTNISPIGDAGAQLAGALLLGAAVGLTAWPLLWTARRRGEHEDSLGGLASAGRRSGLIGLVVTILVILRALDVVGLPVVAFLIITAVLIEVAFTLRH